MNRLESARQNANTGLDKAKPLQPKEQDIFFHGRKEVSGFDIKQLFKQLAPSRDKYGLAKTDVESVQKDLTTKYGREVDKKEYIEEINRLVEEQHKQNAFDPKGMKKIHELRDEETALKKWAGLKGLVGKHQKVTPRYNWTPEMTGEKKSAPALRREGLLSTRGPINTTTVAPQPLPVVSRKAEVLPSRGPLGMLKSIFSRPKLQAEIVKPKALPQSPITSKVTEVAKESRGAPGSIEIPGKPLSDIDKRAEVMAEKVAAVPREVPPAPQNEAQPFQELAEKLEALQNIEAAVLEKGAANSKKASSEENKVSPPAQKEEGNPVQEPVARLGLTELGFQEQNRILDIARELGLLHAPASATPEEARLYEIIELGKLFPRYFEGINDPENTNKMIEEISWKIGHIEKNPENWERLKMEENKLKFLNGMRDMNGSQGKNI